MNVAILGADEISQIVARVIEHGYNPWLKREINEILNVTAYVVGGAGLVDELPALDGKVVLNFRQFAALYRQKLISMIIFPREHFIGRTQTLSRFLSMGVNVEGVFITNRLSPNVFIPNFVEPYLSAKYLPYLEFHAADQCNLNCKACEHYSGLVKEPHFPNLQKFTRDFERLHEFIDDIGTIRILGGEPLLNRDVNEYIKLSRRLYPLANIFVVTNAILLPKMPESFFATLRECRAGIHISFYPPLESKMPAIRRLLEEKHVQFHISPLNKNFTMKQTLNRHDRPTEIFLQCFQAHCHNLYEGKVAACFLPFTTKYFNAYYGKDLPEDGALDLYEPGLSTEKLKAHLLTPFERCRYCTPPVDVEWDTIKNPSPLSDWVHD